MPCAGTSRTCVPASCSTPRPTSLSVIFPTPHPGTSGPSDVRPTRFRWDLGEVADTHLLLILHAEGTVFGADRRDVARAEVPPQLVLVPRHGTGAGVEHTHFAPSKPGAPSCSSSERYRYCGHVSAKTFCPVPRAVAICSSACFADTWTTYSGAPVTSANMIARCVASSSSCHGRGRAVEVRRRVTACDRLLDQDVDGDCRSPRASSAERRSRRQSASPAGSSRRPSRRRRIGHEQLEAGDTFVEPTRSCLQRVAVDVYDDLVESVVDGARTGSLVVPRGEGVLHAHPGVLDGEVDDRGGFRPTRQRAPRLERVGGEGAAETASPCGCGRRPLRGSRTSGRVDDDVARRREVGASSVEPGCSTATIVSPSIRRPGAATPSARRRCPVDERGRHGVTRGP